MLRPSLRLQDSESPGGSGSQEPIHIFIKALPAILKLDLIEKHHFFFWSEFALDSCSVQFSVAVSKRASVGGACTAD